MEQPMSHNGTLGLDELALLSHRLGGLLADPHPGLVTWRESLANVIDGIAVFNGHSPVKADARYAEGRQAGAQEERERIHAGMFPPLRFLKPTSQDQQEPQR